MPCLLTAGSNGSLKETATITTSNNNVGRRWGDAQSIYTQFHTVLPPNSPNCTPSATNGESETLVSASSNHTGGVNAAVMDGSVSFISNTIQTENLDSTPSAFYQNVPNSIQYTGPSIYGIWGRLGSQAGGESASIP
jgi:hypothetical protein